MKPNKAAEKIASGRQHQAAGQMDRAERDYRAAVEAAPRSPEALGLYALCLARRGDFARSAPFFRRWVQATPSDPIAHLNLAAAMHNLGDEQAAQQAFEGALAADPTNRKARMNVAYYLRQRGDFDAARAHQQILLQQYPSDDTALWNLAALDGLAGDFDAAFKGFADPKAMKGADLPRHLPLWDGGPLEGRRILLEAEQGLGDAIMFARLIPRVRDAGGKVLLRAPKAALDLLADFDGVDQAHDQAKPRPAADVWYALADLPAIFGAQSLSDAAAPYLSAAPERVAAWRGRIGQTDRLKVGLVWAGNPDHPDDKDRSAPLSGLLSYLQAVDGVDLYCLQKGGPEAQADGAPLIRIDREIADFHDTAAALTCLDLLITVDTSVLHLAGALGRPVWGLLALAPDWRWGLGRVDSPWYPSLRLFRPDGFRDWNSIGRQLEEALNALAASRAASA